MVRERGKGQRVGTSTDEKVPLHESVSWYSDLEAGQVEDDESTKEEGDDEVESVSMKQKAMAMMKTMLNLLNLLNVQRRDSIIQFLNLLATIVGVVVQAHDDGGGGGGGGRGGAVGATKTEHRSGN